MVKRSSSRDKRRERKRAGSSRRDSTHRSGGDWTHLNIPSNVETFQPKAGSHRIDIIPYEVGEGNPYADQGTWYYERTYYTHNAIGPNNERYVCLAKTAGKACPICDYRAKLARDPDADEKVVDALKPKERQLWLVYDHRDEHKGVQLWDFSHWMFGSLLDKKRKDADEDEMHIKDFDDPDAGATLKVSFSEEKGGGYTYLEAYSIDFKPRPDGLDDELMDHGICLDDCVKLEEYDKLKAIMLQTSNEDEDDDDEDDSPPSRRGRGRSKPDREEEDEVMTADEKGLEEGDMVQHDEFGTCEIMRISKDGTSLTLEDAEGDFHKAVGVADVEKKKRGKPTPKEEPEDDDDDGDDDWDDWGDDNAGGDEKEESPPSKSDKKKETAKADSGGDEWDDW